MSAVGDIPHLKTGRLTFVPVTPELKVSFCKSRRDFEFAVGASLPADWPQFPQAFQPGEDKPDLTYPWHGFLLMDAAGARLIGNGGFVSPPVANGAVEIGYEIGPAFWNQGYATEAVRALIDLAFRNGAREVVAHSLPMPNASNAVMRKAGMIFARESATADAKAIWRYRIENPDPNAFLDRRGW